MYQILQVLTVTLVAVAMALALAHALELPGKLRLPKETYVAVQPIYYPGFTIGGAVGEFGGLIATFVLLLVTPKASAAFWPTMIGFVALAAMHLCYWLVTHPVNRFWVAGQPMGGLGSTFFFATSRVTGQAPGWTELRNRWEYSHVVRAVLGVISLVSLLFAVSG